MVKSEYRHFQWIAPAACSLLSALAATLFSASALAQAYPNKAITAVVPFAAGSGTDIGCRVFIKGAADDLKSPIIVDNKPGGAATVGTSFVVKAAPDGYTLLCLGGGSVSKTFRKNMDFDILTDLAPVVQITRGAMTLMVKGDLPVKNAQEFVEFMRKNPGKYNYASIASSQMMPMEVLKDKTGIQMTHVPYKGLGQVQQSLLSGDTVAYISNPTGLESLFSTGKLRFLVVLDNERNPLLPDVPAAPEVGLAGVLAPFTQAFWAPLKTPTDIINRLNAAFNASLKTQMVQEYLKNNGNRATGGPAQVQLDALRAEHAYWANAAKIAKFEPE